MTGAHESSWMHRVWRDWRREIVRGAALFAVVVAGGLFVIGQVRAFEPLSLLRDGGMHMDFGGSQGDRTWTDAFRWAGVVDRGSAVWIRNLNGAITVEHGAGDSVVVLAQKSARHGDPGAVEVVATPAGGSVTICALWPSSGSATCGPAGEYRMSGTKKAGDVAVRFFVTLPDGVKLDASTVNGGVVASGVAAPLAFETVNGSINVDEVTGTVTATTVNGSITAALASGTPIAALDLKTVNGSIRALVPEGINAELEASTVNGRVRTDLPLQIVGRINPRMVRGTIGSGGTPLHFKAVNGSVTLGTVGASDEPGMEGVAAAVAEARAAVAEARAAVATAPVVPPVPPEPPKNR